MTTQNETAIRANVRQIVEIYQANMGKKIDVPADRGAGTIVVECNNTALDLVVDEMKLRDAGQRFIVPEKSAVSDQLFKSATKILQGIKRSVRMFHTLGVPSEVLPTWERKTRSRTNTSALVPIVDIDAYLDDKLGNTK